MVVLTERAPALDASSTTRASSLGSVTQTSRVCATYPITSIPDESFRHLPIWSDFASTGQTSFVARLPTYTTPSPTQAALGPRVRFLPLASRTSVLNPSTREKVREPVSNTSTVPVNPTGTQ